MRLNDEEGAVTVLVAILLGMGALLGIAAVVVDHAAQLSARRQVQNGSDAAALALAQVCAGVAPGSCSPGEADAEDLVKANADGSGIVQDPSVFGVCASLVRPSARILRAARP